MSRSAACRWSPSRTRTAPSACTRVRRGHARDRVFRGGTIHRVDLESGRWIVARLGSTRFVLARRGTDADDAFPSFRVLFVTNRATRNSSELVRRVALLTHV
jgi:hypothetical protein